MDEEFWHRKWASNEIGFHKNDVNPLLVTHFRALSLAQGSRLFLPLCGKTRDIHWLLAQGYRVSGAELSAIAIAQLFSELGVAPEIAVIDRVTRFSAAGIDIFVGDIFDLSRAELGAVDAIYDRAALIALPAPVRDRYADHLMAITGRAPQLLVTLDYDQSLIDGPPFSVDRAEIDRHYAQSYAVRHLASAEEPGGLKGKVPATEHVWLLTRR
jgi:thiopurine S-methyltransferase